MPNTKALQQAGIDAAVIEALPELARQQANLEESHFWEAGLFLIADKLLPYIVTLERFREGLEFTKGYFHANGVTLASEPGGIYSKDLQDIWNLKLDQRC